MSITIKRGGKREGSGAKPKLKKKKEPLTLYVEKQVIEAHGKDKLRGVAIGAINSL